MGRYRGLQAELDDLEAEDPAVAAAAASYDRMVERLTSRVQCVAATLTHGRRRCQLAPGHPGPHLHDDGRGVTAWGLTDGR